MGLSAVEKLSIAFRFTVELSRSRFLVLTFSLRWTKGFKVSGLAEHLLFPSPSCSDVEFLCILKTHFAAFLK